MKYFLLFLISINLLYSIDSKCGYHLKKPSRIFLTPQGDNKNYRSSQPQDWNNIRIHFDLSLAENDPEFAKDVKDLKEKVLPKTKAALESLIKVKRLTTKLKFDVSEACDVTIPSKYTSTGEGVDADIVILINFDKTYLTQGVEAAATHCIQHEVTRRPLMGTLTFKPELGITSEYAIDYMTWLSIHEITHILVFNETLLDEYVNPDTNEVIPRDQVVGKKTSPAGTQMMFIKSKKVLEKARAHFGCNTLDGVPLEYNGGAGTAGAHWSKRFMNTDYMIGDSYGENLFSEISLALYEDSGWYRVNYENSNLFLWGKGKGCTFFNGKCIENKGGNNYTTQFKDEYCTNINNEVCSIGNVFRAKCEVRKFKSPLPKAIQYFSDASWGGTDSIIDRCPNPIENKQEQVYYGGSCIYGHSKGLKSHEKVGLTSRCFMSSLKVEEDTSSDSEATTTTDNYENERKKKRLGQTDEGILITPPVASEYKASCLQFSCNGNKLLVTVDGTSVECVKEGDKPTFTSFTGDIICPSPQVLCHQKYRCKFGCSDNPRRQNTSFLKKQK